MWQRIALANLPHNNHHWLLFWCFRLSQSRASPKPRCQCPDQGVSPSIGFPPFGWGWGRGCGRGWGWPGSASKRKVAMMLNFDDDLCIDVPCLFPALAPPPGQSHHQHYLQHQKNGEFNRMWWTGSGTICDQNDKECNTMLAKFTQSFKSTHWITLQQRHDRLLMSFVNNKDSSPNLSKLSVPSMRWQWQIWFGPIRSCLS